MEEVLNTERLLLRQPESADMKDLHRWCSDPRVMRFIPGGRDSSREKTRKRLERYKEHHAQHGFGRWLLVERASELLIGDAGLLAMEGTGEIELGYKLAPEWWGQGLATEVASFLLRYGFEALKLPRIIAFTHPENTASLRIIQRLGMKLERRDRYGGMPIEVFSMDQREFGEWLPAT